jgi:hypothetical protein
MSTTVFTTFIHSVLTSVYFPRSDILRLNAWQCECASSWAWSILSWYGTLSLQLRPTQPSIFAIDSEENNELNNFCLQSFCVLLNWNWSFNRWSQSIVYLHLAWRLAGVLAGVGIYLGLFITIYVHNVELLWRRKSLKRKTIEATNG